DGTDYKAVPRRARNLIINGDCQVSQRGTSEASVWGSPSAYGAWPDRFRFERASGAESGRATVSQDTTGPTGFGYCLKVLETTTDSSPSSGDYYRFTYRVEARDIQHLAYGNAAARALTLSFYVFCNLTGAFTVTLGAPDGARTYSTTYTVAAADTWERHTITIPGDTSGTINNDAGIGFEIGWMLGAGSTYTGGTQGSWAATANNMLGAGSTNNVLGSASGDWRITGVQLEVGEVATAFEHLTYAEELNACERYYEREDFTAGTDQQIMSGFGWSTTETAFGTWPYRVEKRAAPTVTYSAPGTFDILYTGPSEIAVSAITAQAISTKGHRVFATVGSASLTAGSGNLLRRDGTDTSFMTMEAEL
ncbi:hypothetical protein CMI47_08225, partial [Candidatus Pacearchaeota archaeon]|nr:hypothetical protein [Candidatus Pacearchaeota archaeon]